MIKSLLVLVLLSIVAGVAVCQDKVVCYYTNWSQYRQTGGKFFPEDIDPHLCTHVIYAFAKLEGTHLKPYEWNDISDGWSKGMYERMMNLKLVNPNLKILLAVGGWTHGSRPFSDLVQTDTAITEFVSNSLAFLKEHKFNGLDLDWEYPSSRDGSRPTDKQRFTKLVQELKKVYAPQGLLLTAAVAAGKSTIDAAYEIDKISQHLDFINLMAYDLHGSWEKFTGHNAPLYPRSNEVGDQRLLNVDYAASYWLKKGCPSHKLILGLGTYGRSFRLADASQHGLGAPVSGGGPAGEITGEAGFLSYYEICSRLSKGFTREFNHESAVPYAYSRTEWVGYDDEQSLEIKVNYVKSKFLGGIMFWALDLDDFKGVYCGKGKYPLINKAKNVLFDGQTPTTPGTTSSTSTKSTSSTRSTSSTSTKSTTTTSSGETTTSSSKCYRGDGYYADKESGCKKYYICQFSGTNDERITYNDCPTGLLFDETIDACNYADQVRC